MQRQAEKLGLIAGYGQFPFEVAKAARNKGMEVIAVAIKDNAFPSLENEVDRLYWVGIAQLGKLIKILKSEGITKAIMAGAVTKSAMYTRFRHLQLRPDLRTLNFWYRRVRDKANDTLLDGVAQELSGEGITLGSCIEYLDELLARPGCITKRQPSKREMEDIEYGSRMAKEMGRLDIGQTVIIKEKTVVAVEAIEGTDEAIKRAGQLANGGTVVVKMSKPNQDLRFDVPTIGPDTIERMNDAGASCLAIEAEKTVVIELEQTIAAADRCGISVIAQ